MSSIAREDAPARAGHRDDVVKAIGCMCLAVSLFPFMNAGVKYLTPHYSMAEIVWARYLGHLVYMVVVFMPRRGWRLFATRRLGTQLIRSLVMFSSTSLYFLGLKGASLATAASISFIGPFIVTALSVPMLGERVGPRRWAAVFVGFAGALIIIRPGFGDMNWSVLFFVANATCYALYQILSRQLAAVDPAETSIAYVALVGVAVTSIAVPFDCRMPESAFHWGVLLSLGIFGGVGHYFVVKAFEGAPASVLSPFSYGQLLWAALLGFAFFGDFPDRWTWVGAAVIVASGLYMTYREAILKKAGTATVAP
ncbi:MAG TPA: DMT family transporter [Candidatus Cybelea sp.]|nr:DMT family transporter [Candidatus Cybelea sp.]